MVTALPAIIRLPLAALLLVVNTIVLTTPLLVIALFKWLVPIRAFRLACATVLVRLAESWIAVNSGLIAVFTPTRFEVRGLEGLRTDGHYLVLSNHRSWVDIPVLQKVLNRRVPFLRFFLKSQLIRVPLLGLAWWALDFPFVKRHSRDLLSKHPELAGQDVLATRRACEKFRGMPVSIMNFVEGTRFTAEKHAHQASEYQHLLRPKAGGVAFVLESMGSALHSLLDVTIAYPGGTPTMLDLLAGRIPTVRVDVREREIPVELQQGDYENDEASRMRCQRWINSLWESKDQRYAQLSKIEATQPSTPPRRVS